MTYWSDRQQELLGRMEKDEKLLMQRLAREYQREAGYLDKEIAAYYAKYGEKNVIEYRRLMQALDPADRMLLIQQMNEFAAKYPQYAHLMPVRESIYKLNRLEGLQHTLLIQQYEAGIITQKKIDEYLRSQGLRVVNSIAKDMGFGSQFYTINSQLIQKTVGAAWSQGRNFSQRIWANQEALARTLNTEIMQGLIRGDTYRELTKTITNKFIGTTTQNAYRLVYTEGTYVLNESAMSVFEGYYDEYRYSAILDEKTSRECQALHGLIFKISERTPGVNFPPMHPWCRSSFEVVIPEDFVERYVGTV